MGWTLTGATQSASGQPVGACATSGHEAILGGAENIASGGTATLSGGANNTASGPEASIGGGKFNIANDVSPFIGGGCDNLTGSGNNNTNYCGNSGGEAILGGVSITVTSLDAHSP